MYHAQGPKKVKEKKSQNVSDQKYIKSKQKKKKTRLCLIKNETKPELDIKR